MLLVFLIFVVAACQASENGGDAEENGEIEEIEKEQQSKGEFKIIDPMRFYEMSKSPNNQLVDVRTSMDFSIERIEFAVNKDFSKVSFLREIMTLNPEHPLLLYDQNGSIAQNAAELLIEEGFAEIYVLEGGIDNYKEHGFETTKEAP